MVKDEVPLRDGMNFYTVAQTKVSRGDNLSEVSDEISLVAVSWFKKRYACGHRGPRKFVLLAYRNLVCPSYDNKKCPDCCIKEIQKTVIPCPWCGRLIFPGQLVSLHPSMGMNLLHAHFVRSKVVCCVDCDPPLMAGYWTKEGFKPFPLQGHK